MFFETRDGRAHDLRGTTCYHDTDRNGDKSQGER